MRQTSLTRPPFSWIGGKVRQAKLIASLLPPHFDYYEPFGGSGAVLLCKLPSEVEVFNDIDESLVNFYSVVQNEGDFAKLMLYLFMMPQSRALFKHFATHHTKEEDPVRRAAEWFFCASQAIHGSWARDTGYSFTACRGANYPVIAYSRNTQRLMDVHIRLANVTIESLDWRRICKRAGELSCGYFDPPYHPDTRSEIEYRHELSGEEHKEFVDYMLTEWPGSAIVSAYEHPEYLRLVAEGKYTAIPTTKDVPSVVYGSDKGDPEDWDDNRTELLLLSPLATRFAIENGHPLFASRYDMVAEYNAKLGNPTLVAPPTGKLFCEEEQCSVLSAELTKQ